MGRKKNRFQRGDIVNGNGKGKLNPWVRFKVVEHKHGGWVSCVKVSDTLTGLDVCKVRATHLMLLKAAE